MMIPVVRLIIQIVQRLVTALYRIFQGVSFV